MIDHRRHELAIVRLGGQRRRRLFEAGLDVDEAGRRQAIRGDFGIGELPRPGPVAEERRERLGACITCSASSCARRRFGPPPHCACSRPPGRSARENAGEQRRMILDPMEGRGAEHQIGPAGKWQIRAARPARTRRASRAPAGGWRAPSSTCSTNDRSRSGGPPEGVPSARRSGVRCRSRHRSRARRRCTVRRSRTFWPQLVCGPETL